MKLYEYVEKLTNNTQFILFVESDLKGVKPCGHNLYNKELSHTDLLKKYEKYRNYQITKIDENKIYIIDYIRPDYDYGLTSTQAQ